MAAVMDAASAAAAAICLRGRHAGCRLATAGAGEPGAVGMGGLPTMVCFLRRGAGCAASRRWEGPAPSRDPRGRRDGAAGDRAGMNSRVHGGLLLLPGLRSSGCHRGVTVTVGSEWLRCAGARGGLPHTGLSATGREPLGYRGVSDTTGGRSRWSGPFRPVSCRGSSVLRERDLGLRRSDHRSGRLVKGNRLCRGIRPRVGAISDVAPVGGAIGMRSARIPVLPVGAGASGEGAPGQWATAEVRGPA